MFCLVWLAVSLLDALIHSPWFSIFVLPLYAPFFIAGMLLYLMISGRWLVTAGALTYPFYLVHQQIGETIIRSFGRSVPPWMLLAGVFVVTLLLAWLVQRFVERPLAGWVRAVLYGGLAILPGFGRGGSPSPAPPEPVAPQPEPATAEAVSADHQAAEEKAGPCAG